MKVIVEGLVGFVSLAGLTVLGDVLSKEIRGRLDLLPEVLLRVAVRQVPADSRDEFRDEWNDRLHEILLGSAALPVTRLLRSIRFVADVFFAAMLAANANVPLNDHEDSLPETLGFLDARDETLGFLDARDLAPMVHRPAGALRSR